MTTSQESNNKKTRCMPALMIVVAMLPLMAIAIGDSSDPTFVYVNPKSCYHWHTATNSTMVLPVYFPRGASYATLSVNGTVQISGITTDSVTVNLPTPRCGASEEVYDLALAFDEGTVYTTRLGLLNGFSGCGDTGATRCITPYGDKAWGRVNGLAVIPVPCATTSLTVALNGGEPSSVNTGLDGSAGWCAITLSGATKADISAITLNEVLRSMLYGTSGFIMAIR